MAVAQPATRIPFAVRPTVPEHEVLAPIGAGACGEVWLARTVTGTRRAVKVVWRDHFEHERQYEREFAGLLQCEPVSRTHEALVDILQVGREDARGYFYYVMELADDRGSVAVAAGPDHLPDGRPYEADTLAARLANHRRLPVAECARLGAAVAGGLAHLHTHGLVHRDVKPSNLIFVAGQPKLADIGLVARVAEAKSFVGTEGYIAPEGPGKPAADIFALGRVLYEMATGRSRLEFPELPAGLRDATDAAEFAELNEIILRACAPEAGERFATADELRRELLLVQAGQSVRRLRANERRLRRLRRVAVVGAALLVAGAALLVVQRQQTGRAQARAAGERRQREALAIRERLARINLYAADMNLARQALEEGNYGRAQTLLETYQPTPGAEDLRGFEWRQLAQLVRGDPRRGLRGHTGAIGAVAFHPTDGTLFSASYDGTVRRWDVAAGRELGRWTNASPAPVALAFSPNGGEFAVVGGGGGRAQRWTPGNGTESFPPLEPGFGLAYTPDGRMLIHGLETDIFGTSGSVELLGLAPPTRQRLPESGGRLTVSADGTRLATGAWGDSVKLWQLPAGTPLSILPGVGVVLALQFAPRDGRLALATRTGELLLWDTLASTSPKRVPGHGGKPIWAVVWSPDGTQLATAGVDQAVCVWRADTLELSHTFHGHGAEVFALAWSPDGSTIVSGDKDGGLQAWRSVPPPPMAPMTQLAGDFVLSPDGRWLAAERRVGDVGLWDTQTGALVATLPGKLTKRAFSADGKVLHVAFDHDSLRRYSVPELTPVAGETVFEKVALHCGRRALSPDSRWLAGGDPNGTIQLWDARDGRHVATLTGHTQSLYALAFSPDNRWLASCGADRTARVWELATRREHAVIHEHQLAPFSVAFSADSGLLATGGLDDLVFVWRLPDMVRLARLPGHTEAASAVAFLPDGRTLAALCGSGQVKLWNLESRREAGGLHWPEGRGGVWLASSPDGGLLAATTREGTVKFWRAPAATGPQD